LHSSLRLSLLAGVALALAACRAFPVGMYVPDSVLDALETSGFEEHVDEHELARELASRAGERVRPAAEAPGTRYWRLDVEPVRGPHAPAAFEAADGEASDGLEPGDLVLAKNGRPQSLGTTLSVHEFTFYDHAGVLVERGGRFYVCDSWPRFHPLVKAEDFAGHFRGGVRATPLARFLAHYETLLFVRLGDPERNARLARAALASLELAAEYDPHHDPEDPRLSCSEYVEALLERAGYAPPAEARALTADAEMLGILAALGFPAGGFLVPDQLAALPGVRQVGWISRHGSRAGARAIEAAFALLHARFLGGTRVGDFLRVDRFRFLRYRRNVARFLAWAEGWAEARGVEERAELERDLGELLPLFFRTRSDPEETMGRTLAGRGEGG
jgi:hypothetical protein